MPSDVDKESQAESKGKQQLLPELDSIQQKFEAKDQQISLLEKELLQYKMTSDCAEEEQMMLQHKSKWVKIIVHMHCCW